MSELEIPIQALSDVIGEIFDCALAPERWPETCRKIADLCESSSGGICIHDLRHTQSDQLFVFGYEPTFLQKLASVYAASPMAASDIVSNIGDVKSLAMEDDDLSNSRFFREVLEPSLIQDIMWFPALRTRERMASLHVARGRGATVYSKRELEVLKLVAPHICRALSISDALDINSVHSDMLERTLDSLAASVHFTASDGRVVYMNAAAEDQIKAGKSLRIINNRISPTDPVARQALADAIDKVARFDFDHPSIEHSLAIPAVSGGAGYVATLLPVSQGQRRDVLLPYSASVAVFIKNPVEAAMMPGEAFSRLYGLTGEELLVLLALAEGLGGKEAAEMLGISEATVRTHLQRIFAKTRTKRQADLLRLLQNSALPIMQGKSRADFPAD